MNKLIITRWNQAICTALAQNGKILQLELEPDCEKSILNNIYIGKVQNIVKNINAAFVEIGNGVIGYYSLSENQQHWYGNGSCGSRLRIGDEIIVQVSRDAVKTKAPVLTGKFVFTGKLTVLTIGKNGLSFSSKILDRSWKDAIKKELCGEIGEKDGLIIRTNGKHAAPKELLTEFHSLQNVFQTLINDAPFRTCYTRLYQAPSTFLTNIRNAYADLLEEIVTDEVEIFEEIKHFLEQEQPEDLKKLRFYQDPLLPLKNLYCLDQVIQRAEQQQVWLKSGGYLVIQPTEALVVVDVNTGKYSGKKTKAETILKINMEAAEEIGVQLRLRNLSGIIIIDFIDMQEEESRMLLLEHLKTAVLQDPVKTTVVDFTKLNLVELTRKKIHKPLHEQIAACLTL